MPNSFLPRAQSRSRRSWINASMSTIGITLSVIVEHVTGSNIQAGISKSRRRSSRAVQSGQQWFACEEGAKGIGLPKTQSYVCYVADLYHRSRTHLSLGKDSPELRAIQPPEMGSVVSVPQVGGLHRRYERQAA